MTRIPADEAMAALSGIRQPAYSSLLWSLGHHEPEHAAVLVRWLRAHCADRKWPKPQLDAMISLCLGELSDGYALDASARLSETARAQWLGVSRSQWYAVWRHRYHDLSRVLLRQIAMAQDVMMAQG